MSKQASSDSDKCHEEKKQLSLSTKGFMPTIDIQNELEEDEMGFENLMDKLPEWINETKKEIENSDN